MLNNSNAHQLRGMLIRDARKRKNLTQLECALRLGVSEKTLRNYEVGEVTRIDFDLLRNIALLLEIEPEQFDLSSHHIYTLEEAKELLEKGWSSLETGDFKSAYHIGEALVRSLTRHSNDIKPQLLDPLARAHFLAGHAHTIIRENREGSQAFEHFKAMETIATTLGNDTLLCIARTYQGEMLRRDNRVEAAINIISAAPQGPLVDIAVRGNRSQLLARAYASYEDIGNFKMQMERAEDLARQCIWTTGDTYIPYNLGSVYEEYARVFALYGNVKESKKYIDLAERSIPQTPRWTTLIKLTKGETLIRATAKVEYKHPENLRQVNDFRDGIALIGEAAKLAHKYGHRRLLRRAYNLQKSFANQALKSQVVVLELGEILDKSISNEYVMSDEY